MKFRNTWIVAALFLGFAAYLAFVEAPRHDEAEGAKKLFPFKADDVVGLTLTYPDHQIVLKKGDAGWKIVNFADTHADCK